MSGGGGAGGTDENMSEVSASAANVTYDGKHPLLEFAMQYFRDAQLFTQQVRANSTFVLIFNFELNVDSNSTPT